MKHEQRLRSTVLLANLTKHVLKADLAIFSKLGGGVPESDLLLSIDAVEKIGVKTSAVLWSYLGDGTISDSISASSDYANALASVGIYDESVQLPGQKQLFGDADPASTYRSPINVYMFKICGAISQVGASQVAMVEI